MRAKNQLRQAIDSLHSNVQPTRQSIYTRLVLDCVRANDLERAKRLQTDMEQALFEPNDTFIHNRLLHLYAKFGKISYVQNLFDRMPNRDVFSWNALLSAYAKSGSVEKLNRVFGEMPVKDSVSYNIVISGFSGNGFYVEALRVLARMQREGFELTDYSYVSGLQACSLLVDLRRGREIHGRILVRNMGGDNVFVWNALIDMYAKCREFERAKWLFDRMLNRTVVSWNLIISGYLRNRQPEKCIDMFREMKVSRVKPDEFTFSDVLGAYIEIGDLNEARKIFCAIRAKDKVCWTTMIVGYTQKGMEEEALTLFHEMLLKGIEPDSFTISSVVTSCAKLASLHQGQALHAKSIVMGIDENLLLSSSLVNVYCKCGVTKDAWDVFSRMPARNVVSWNSIIGGYTQNGQDLEALALFEKMQGENLRPDSVTFVSVLSACSHAGLVEQGERYFNSMSQKHGLTPTLDHYACMINLLGNSGHIDKAVDLVKGIPQEPNSLIWSTLLAICSKKDDIKHGEIAARNLFELDPLNAAPYITLSNMYAKSGRWEHMAALRSMMKAKNVKKFAAYSWVEIDDKVFKFVSDDRTHPETEKIYKELRRLIQKLQQETVFTPNTNLVLHDVMEDEKVESICYHSEKLALAFWLIRKPNGTTPIRIMKNIRVCSDCHVFMKFVSKVIGRRITLRDSNRFHHFVGGVCSCRDYW